eukprot:scaffold116915_cov27-Prasinocladus_malaysianus.AAC.1
MKCPALHVPCTMHLPEMAVLDFILPVSYELLDRVMHLLLFKLSIPFLTLTSFINDCNTKCYKLHAVCLGDVISLVAQTVPDCPPVIGHGKLST